MEIDGLIPAIKYAGRRLSGMLVGSRGSSDSRERLQTRNGLVVAQVALALAMALALFRMLRGPRAQDRVLGLDALYLNSMLLLLVFGIRTGNTMYFEASLIIGTLGFVATVALAKFLMRGEVIE